MANGEYFLSHDMGKLFLRLADSDIDFTFKNPSHIIDVRTSVDYLIRIRPASTEHKQPYQVTQMELVKGTTSRFKKKATEYWDLNKLVNYLFSECDG